MLCLSCPCLGCRPCRHQHHPVQLLSQVTSVHRPGHPWHRLHMRIVNQTPSRMRLQAPQRVCGVVCGEESCEQATHQPCPGSPSSWTCSLRHADFLLTLPSVRLYCLELWWNCPLLLIPLQSLCKCWAARNACKTTTSGGGRKTIGAEVKDQQVVCAWPYACTQTRRI